ncbi:MAG: hypothetical protein RLZZ384_697, partial [Pseudomonadota bacterium]
MPNSTASSENVHPLESALLVRLSTILETYLDVPQVEQCIHAYRFGAAAHIGQFRKSGEPYICHPIAVATSL